MAVYKWRPKNPEEIKKYSLVQQFKDSWKYSKGFRFVLIIALIMAGFAGLLDILPSFLYGRLVEDLSISKFNLIYLYVIFIGLAHLFYSLLDRLIDHVTYKNNYEIRNRTRINFYNFLFGMDFEFFEKHPSGTLLSQVSEGANDVRTFNKHFYRKFLIGTFTFVFALISLIYLHLPTAIIGVVVLGIYLMWARFTDMKKIQLEYETSLSSDATQGRIIDYLSHFQLVKLLNIRMNLLRELQKAHRIVMKKAIKSRNYMNKIVFVQMNILKLSLPVVLLFLALSVVKGDITIGILVTVFTLYGRFVNSYARVREEYNQILETKVGMYKLHLLSENKSNIEEPKHPKKVNTFSKISFDNITFTYPGKKKPALENVTFDVKKGEKLAIVGMSGSGKSTISKLLFKMYLPDRGHVKLGNTDTREIKSEDLYGLMKVVPQENELINTTIYENLRLGTPSQVSRDDIVKSLKQAHALNFIKKLPKMFLTLVGPNGVKLSGGEKQRLCIARALLSEPKLLVLDEATSHLDVLTESKIHDSLHKLGKDQTVIAITHRISSMYLFDRIIVMDKGKIVGEGTHSKLLKNNEQYKKLWKQSKKLR